MGSTFAHSSAVVLSSDLRLRLIRDAIAMVASGGASRVVVAGIGSGRMLLDPARRLALEAGVRARPLWHADGTGADIAVEQITE